MLMHAVLILYSYYTHTHTPAVLIVRPDPIFANMNEDPYIYRNTHGFHAIFHGMDIWPEHVGRHGTVL
jgi:hypothetical protein